MPRTCRSDWGRCSTAAKRPSRASPARRGCYFSRSLRGRLQRACSPPSRRCSVRWPLVAASSSSFEGGRIHRRNRGRAPSSLLLCRPHCGDCRCHALRLGDRSRNDGVRPHHSARASLAGAGILRGWAISDRRGAALWVRPEGPWIIIAGAAQLAFDGPSRSQWRRVALPALMALLGGALCLLLARWFVFPRICFRIPTTRSVLRSQPDSTTSRQTGSRRRFSPSWRRCAGRAARGITSSRLRSGSARVAPRRCPGRGRLDAGRPIS